MRAMLHWIGSSRNTIRSDSSSRACKWNWRPFVTWYAELKVFRTLSVLFDYHLVDRHETATWCPSPSSVLQNIALEETLRDSGSRFDCDIKGLQASIDRLEAELCDVRSSISQQLCEHEALLNAKMKLEMEIATYRRLIETEG